MNTIADRIIELYELDKRGNIKKLAERMGISATAVQNYRSCETPPQKLLQQITKDFDGKEGRPQINWNWLFTGIEPKFKSLDDLPPEPPTKETIDNASIEALKEMIQQLDLKLSNEIQQIKLQIQKDGFVTSGIITRLSAVENRLNLGLGKLNANTKVFEISAKNERLFNPLVVKKLPAIG